MQKTLSKDDIIRMALKCGATIKSDCEGNGVFGDGIDLLQFAALAAAAEREKWEPLFAAVMREMPKSARTDGNAPGHCHRIPGVWDNDNGELSGKQCAWCYAWHQAEAAIRARGQE